MDAELKRRVEALRRPLELAARDGFAGVRKVQGLGHALRAACDAVIARLPGAEALAAWRATLGRWEQLDELQQELEVARGMRLLARMPRGAAPVAARADGDPAAPEAEADPLAAPTHSLPGIGPALAERLAERGLVTVEDLLWTLPRRYDDVRGARPLAEVAGLDEGVRATFAARVTSARMVFVRGRRWADVRLAGVDAADRTTAVVRWFNVYAGIDKRMPPGSVVVLSGPVRRRGGKLELANPDTLGIEPPADGPNESGAPAVKAAILARYPDIPGVPAGAARGVRGGARGSAPTPATACRRRSSAPPGCRAWPTRSRACTRPRPSSRPRRSTRSTAATARGSAGSRSVSCSRSASRSRAPRERRADAAVPCAPRAGAEPIAATLARAAVRADRRAAPRDRRAARRPRARRADEPPAPGRRRLGQDVRRVRRRARGRARGGRPR